MYYVLNERHSTSFPSDLVNKSCTGFVYQFCLMSKDSPDYVCVCVYVCTCVFVSDRESAKRAAVIGIFADARKQQQHKKALEQKEKSCICTESTKCTCVCVCVRGLQRSICLLRGKQRYTSICSLNTMVNDHLNMQH